MTEVVGFDCTHANIVNLPRGQQVAGYSTGSPDIKWTAEDWAAHSGALRIVQDDGLADSTADYADVERGAGTNAQAAGWYRRAVIAYRAGVRPGQRWPAIYTSASNVTPLVNELVAARVMSGPRLIIARWDLLATVADILAIANAGGPYPVVGYQVINGQFWDVDLFSASWLSAVSKAPAEALTPPPWQETALVQAAELASDASDLLALIKAHQA